MRKIQMKHSSPKENASSAFLNRCSKNVRVHPVVIAELSLGNIERHVFLANFVECADDGALEDRPEAFDGLRVDRANHIEAGRVVDDGVLRELLIEVLIAYPLVGAEQAYFIRDGFIYEGRQGGSLYVLNNAGDNITLAANSASDRRLAGTNAASSVTLATLVDMPVLCEAANESFVNLDNSGQLLELFSGERGADAVHHVPSGLIAFEAHDAMDLPGTDAFLARQHEVNDAEPIAKRFIGVLENRAGKVRKAVAAATAAIRAFPVPLAGFQVINPSAAAARAAHAFRPSLANKVSAASLFIGEQFLELFNRHLDDLRLLLLPGHCANPLLC